MGMLYLWQRPHSHSPWRRPRRRGGATRDRVPRGPYGHKPYTSTARDIRGYRMDIWADFRDIMEISDICSHGYYLEIIWAKNHGYFGLPLAASSSREVCGLSSVLSTLHTSPLSRMPHTVESRDGGSWLYTWPSSILPIFYWILLPTATGYWLLVTLMAGVFTWWRVDSRPLANG